MTEKSVNSRAHKQSVKPVEETLAGAMRGGGAAAPASTPDFGPQTLRAWLARASGAHPHKPYLHFIDEDRSISYAEMQEAAGRIAGYLAACRIGGNDRVVLLADNSLEHLVMYVGVLAAGATICTVHVEMNRGNLDSILHRLAPKLVLYEEGLGVESLAGTMQVPWRPLGRWSAKGGEGVFADMITAAKTPACANPADAGDAAIVFTSGTTAKAKGVVLSHRELLSNAVATATAFGIGPEDRLYDYRSFNWVSAQILSALAILSQGATLHFRRKFSRTRFFSDIARLRTTIAAGNPTVVNMLLQGEAGAQDADLANLRFMISSSAPLLVEEWQRFEERFGIRLAQGYGSSETGWISGSTGEARRLGAAGKPLPYLRTAIVDCEGRPLPTGEVGYIEVGGFEDVPFRYIAADGGIHVSAVGRAKTGDMGHFDSEGYLHLTGREKDLIIRGGVNISPLEIDGILARLADVAEVMTIGVPDRIYGEEVVSYVVLKPGRRLSESDILKFCMEHLTAFKAPKQIVFSASLPKTARGKLDRKALVEAWRRANLAAAGAPGNGSQG